MRWRLVLVILLVISSSSAVLSEATGLGYAVVTFTTDKGQVQVQAEVAKTPSEEAQGLMFRTVLAQDAGMLFVFDQDQVLSFWMMNTSIPLDGIFISSKLQVVSVAENLKPCPPDSCVDPVFFGSIAPAMYALEVNAGFSGKNDIKVGTEVSINQSATTSTISIMTPETTTTFKSSMTTVGSSSSPALSMGFAFAVIGIGAGVASAAGGLALAMSGQHGSEVIAYGGYYYCRKHRVPLYYVEGKLWCPLEQRHARTG